MENAEWLVTVDLKYLRHAEDALLGAFVFTLTPEGGDYWWSIIKRLRAMADQAAKAPAKE